jgi:hypothetical protein
MHTAISRTSIKPDLLFFACGFSTYVELKSSSIHLVAADSDVIASRVLRPSYILVNGLRRMGHKFVIMSLIRASFGVNYGLTTVHQLFFTHFSVF